MTRHSLSIFLVSILISLVLAQSSTIWVTVVSKFYNASLMKYALCGVCQIPEGTNPITIYDNFAVNSIEQSTDVFYFVTSANQGNSSDSNRLEILIDQILTKPSIIVISTESTNANIQFSISDSIPSVQTSFISQTKYILINSKQKSSFKFKDETLSSKITVKYYCNDNCGSDMYVYSGENSNIWKNGGMNFEFDMRQRIGANFTTFIGCQKSTKFSIVSSGAICNNGETELTLSIVLPVVLGGGFLVCLCCCVIGCIYCGIQCLL